MLNYPFGKGGPTSGNRGHQGRPGQRGGSISAQQNEAENKAKLPRRPSKSEYLEAVERARKRGVSEAKMLHLVGRGFWDSATPGVKAQILKDLGLLGNMANKSFDELSKSVQNAIINRYFKS